MRRHPLDILSLVFGVVFVAAAVAFAADSFDISLLRPEWVAAVALLGLGATLLLTARRSNGRNGS